MPVRSPQKAAVNDDRFQALLFATPNLSPASSIAKLAAAPPMTTSTFMPDLDLIQGDKAKTVLACENKWPPNIVAFNKNCVASRLNSGVYYFHFKKVELALQPLFQRQPLSWSKAIPMVDLRLQYLVPAVN